MINSNDKEYFKNLLIGKYKKTKKELVTVLKKFPNGKPLKVILHVMSLSEKELGEALTNTINLNPGIDIFLKEIEGKEEQWIKIKP